jgi:hypothetical protein
LRELGVVLGKKMLNNKKAIGFPLLFIIVVLIALPFLCIAVQKQIDSFGRTVGAQHVPFIRVNKNIYHDLLELDVSAEEEFEYSLKRLSERNGFYSNPCGNVTIIRKKECSVINLKQDLESFCFPDISASLNYFFNIASKYSDNILLKNNDFEIYVDGKEVKGIPLSSEFFNFNILPDASPDVLGGFSFRPVFSFKSDNELNFYPEIFYNIQNVYEKCKYDKNVSLCFQKFVKDFSSSDDLDWSYEFKEDIFYFWVFFDDFLINDDYSGFFSRKNVCYGVHLPDFVETEI